MKSTKLLATLLLFIAAAFTATAYDFSAGYFHYNKTSGNTVELAGCKSDLPSAAKIPSAVKYDGVTYTVTSIGDYAFEGCSGLTSVTIPNSVTSIGSSAFYKCYGLTSVHITDIAAWCKIMFGGFYANPLSYAHKLYLNGTEVKDLVIPNSVTEIKDYAFNGCSGLTSVTIPNSVTSIGESAFYNCSGLTSVTIPNSVTSIGSSAFSGCSGLKSVTIPNSVTSIGVNAFVYCDGLTSVTIPNSVTSIGSGAFSSCYGLKSVTIGNSVATIGERAFYACIRLTSVTIPNSVTSIGSCAFEGCERLTSVHITDIAAWCKIDFDGGSSNPLYYAHKLYLNGTEVKDLVIPNSVTEIKDYAFSGCESLAAVTIGGNVSKIGGYAFSGCTNLSTVYSYAATPPVMPYNVFSSETYSRATLYVPKGCVLDYEAANYWYRFNNIVEGNYAGVDDVIADEAADGTAAEIVGYYNLQGVRSDEPWDGLNIVVYSDGTRRKMVK